VTPSVIEGDLGGEERDVLGVLLDQRADPLAEHASHEDVGIQH